MGIENLATVIGPNVFRSKDGGQQIELRDSVKVNLLMKIMILQRKEMGQALKNIVEKSQEEGRIKQAAKEEMFQMAIQRSHDEILVDPTKSEKKRGRRGGSLQRQLSKKSPGNKRASTSSVATLWSGKLTLVHSSPTIGNPPLPSSREKRNVGLPPPKGATRTIQELEEILLQEMHRRYELEEILQTEIAARQELDRKLSEFLSTLRDASRLLVEPRQ